MYVSVSMSMFVTDHFLPALADLLPPPPSPVPLLVITNLLAGWLGASQSWHKLSLLVSHCHLMFL